MSPVDGVLESGGLGPLSEATILVFSPVAAGSEEGAKGGDLSSVTVHFHPKPGWLPWLRHFPISIAPTSFDVLEPWALEIVSQCVRSLTLASATKTRYSDALIENAIERLLLLVIQCHENVQPNIDLRIAKVARLLRSNTGAEVTIDSAAALVGLSPSRLSHLFRDQMGVTFSNYSQLAKVQRARCLLESSDATSTTVAKQLGMNPSYFSSWFRKWCGISPTEYRLE